jgi:D-3-phosphoglycerate dehydrogenase
VDYAARPQPVNNFEYLKLDINTRHGAHTIDGAVFADGLPRILAIDQYRMELIPERELVLIFNDDRPGVIGLVGTLFGDAGVNIADMSLSRRERTALMVLKLDQKPGDDLLNRLRNHDAIVSAQSVTLPALACVNSATS